MRAPTKKIFGASNLKTGGVVAGQAWIDAYTGHCYHQTCDTIGADWNLAGAVQDLDLIGTITDELAHSARWPQWKPGSEFEAIRAKSEAARK